MHVTIAPLPIVDPTTCAVGSSGSDGCRICIEHCPYGAIDIRSRPEGSEIRIDPLLCQRCGACSGVCPTSSVNRPFLPDSELMASLVSAARAGNGPVVAITCPASAASVVESMGAASVVVTPSLLILNETHLLTAIVAGARAVLLVGCPRCTHDQPHSLMAPLSTVRAIVDHPSRVSYLEDDGSGRLGGAVHDSGLLSAPPYRLEEAAWDALAHAASRRERIATLLPAFGPGSTTPLVVSGFGTVELDLAACVACGACAINCPTDALVLDPTIATLSVIDADCIGCGICASVCPDDAIRVLPAVPVGAGALEARILLTDEAVACRTCGDRYTPRRLLDHARAVLEAAQLDPDDPRLQLGVCPACRNPHARPEQIGAMRITDFDGCGDRVGTDHSECGCSGDTVGDRLQGSVRSDGMDESRRSFLKGVLTAAVAGTVMPLFGRPAPAMAAETPVIVPGRMGMVIDLDRCIGCHACTNVCKAENNVPLGKFRDWVEEHVLGEYPNARPVFLPKLCNHCDDPGCLRACPTGAIRKRPDGIVDLDPDICIACQACMQGCPYGMTFYNHQRGTADKCNLCAHRIDEGLNPACVDVCPSQCRIVGDFDDPDSPVSRYLAERASTAIREDYGLGPNVRYVGLPGELNR